MKIEQLKPDITVRGTIFPEPIQVIVTVLMGDSVKFIGKGTKSGKVYEPVLNAEQLGKLEASLEKEPFTGDSKHFRLGIEASSNGARRSSGSLLKMASARINGTGA